jgi:hypothetical protein
MCVCTLKIVVAFLHLGLDYTGCINVVKLNESLCFNLKLDSQRLRHPAFEVENLVSNI